MSTQTHTMTCPLCGYETDIEYNILLHMEEHHAEGPSPFVADPDIDVSRSRDDTLATKEDVDTDEDAELFVDCPVDGCLEQISFAELEDHINFHGMEENEQPTIDSDAAAAAAATTAIVAPSAMNEREYRSPYSRPEDVARSNREHERERARSPTTHDSAVDAWKKIFNRRYARKTKDSEKESADGKTTRERLGRSELGKHAYENRMPDSLVALLKKGKYTSAEGIIPVLARLLEQSQSTEYAFLCDPAVQHISKLRGEGGFCGYRNIQMLSSYIIGARAEGAEQLRNKIPSIFRIQEYIENAWDMGINASGRIETGGIRGTRKYIGTPDAQAMFIGLNIPCEVEGFKSPKHGVAEAALFASVQQYFERASFDQKDKIRCTNLPPIYFQYRGHSLTIVGFERRASGSLKLLVFDPMFRDPDGVIRLIGRAGDMKEDKNKIRHAVHRSPDAMLGLYRRGNNDLKKHHEFEILRLKTHNA